MISHENKKWGGGTFLSVYFLSSDNKVGVVAGVFKGAQFLATRPVYNVAITASSRKNLCCCLWGEKESLLCRTEVLVMMSFSRDFEFSQRLHHGIQEPLRTAEVVVIVLHRRRNDLGQRFHVQMLL